MHYIKKIYIIVFATCTAFSVFDANITIATATSIHVSLFMTNICEVTSNVQNQIFTYIYMLLTFIAIY